MNDRKRILFMTVIMVAVAVAVGGTAILLLSRMPLESQHDRLMGRPALIQVSLLIGGVAIIALGLATLAFISLIRPLLRRLEDSENQLRQAVIGVPFPVMIHAQDGRVLMTSNAWHQLSGYSREELKTTDDWTHRAYRDALQRDAVMANIRQLYTAKERVEEGEYAFTTAKGEKRVWQFSSSPLGLASDGKRCVLTIANDVTTRWEAQAELAQVKEAMDARNKGKDRFLANLSHELRTPLTPVLVLLSMLQEDPQVPAGLREHLSTMRSSVERESLLIDGLQDLSRVRRGQMRMRMEVANAHELVQAALVSAMANKVGHHPTVRHDLSAGECIVKVDRAMFQQVCWNIIKNAMQFTNDSGTLTIRSGNSSDGMLELQFIDSGIGIDAEFLPQVFDVFAASRGGSNRCLGGLGLGLTIAKALMEQMGGSIHAASEGRGKGATFTIRIPVAKPDELQRAPASALAEKEAFGTPTKSQRILLVEDHAATRKVLTQVLTLMGHKIKSAATVQEALALAQSDSFDLLISDIALSDGSGLDVMRWFAMHRPIRGIAVSGYGMDADIQDSRDAGFAVHLVKPIPISELREAIQDV